MLRHLLLLVVCGVVAHAQDWAAIDKEFAAVRAAVEARDLKALVDASGSLSRLTLSEWLKNHTPADNLRRSEDLAAAHPAARTTALPSMAMLAAQAGEWQKARRYAQDALATPATVIDSVHIANNVLGLVALHDGDVTGAELYLRAAGSAKGDTSLKRWGPTLALAKALLDRGRNQAVLEYLQACQSFVTDNPKLAVWIATLKGGGAPDLSHEYLWYF